MWEKPEIKKPNFNNISFKEMTEQEEIDITGQSVGTCLLVGYSCWNSGGFGVGTCLLVGYACWSKGQ